MTALLVSVRNVHEAREALAGGADVIDIKEPARGALGPADPAVWRTVMAEVAGRAPVSAAFGELVSDPVALLAGQSTGLAFVKVGLAGCGLTKDWPERFRTAVESVPAATTAVPVAYADWQSAAAPAPGDVLRFASELPGKLLLVDTFGKHAAGLLECLSWQELAQLAEQAALAGVRLALAGSLEAAHLPRLMELAPAYIGVRGAACAGGRAGVVDRALVKSLTGSMRGTRSAVAV